MNHVPFDNEDISAIRATSLKNADEWLERKIDPDLILINLQFGWMRPYLFTYEGLLWGRWNYWRDIIANESLPDEPIPQIDFSCGDDGDGEWSLGVEILEKCLKLIPRNGKWRTSNDSIYLEYFLDWILFGLGCTRSPELPVEPEGCKGASARLYQFFPLQVFLIFPWDYWGHIFARTKSWERNGLSPMPHEKAKSNANIPIIRHKIDKRLYKIYDSWAGTGRQLLYLSNRTLLCLYTETDRLMAKALTINLFLYAPWIVSPLSLLNDLAEQDIIDPVKQDTIDSTKRDIIEPTKDILDKLTRSPFN